MTPDSPRRRVLLEIETSIAPGRDMLRGIAKFVREARSWDTHHDAGNWSLRGVEPGPSYIEPLPKNSRLDGIITRIYDPASERAALRSIEAGRAVVDVLGEGVGSGVPLVHCDDSAIAKMALDHLRERGFRKFAFCGIGGTSWSARRRDAFREEVGKLGEDLSEIEVSKAPVRTGEGDAPRVKRWLATLPRPVALFVSCDHIAPLVFEGCRRLGIAVPEQAAIVGVNNDTVACNLCSPTLSSVDASHFDIGYRAARLLDSMMRGEDPPEAPIYIPPRGLVVRGSSGASVIEDPLIARAVRYIARNAGSPIGVADVVGVVPISRRELQRRFRDATGSTIHSAILDARMNLAKRLLGAHNYTIDAIAEMSGFGSRQHFAKTFKAHTGTSPSEYGKDLAVV